MTTPRVDSFVQLSDQRRLAFAEYGDPDGLPIFLFHGLPGSRLSWGLLPGQPFPPGVRLIAPDRPGFGRSDPKPNRTVADWANDVTELADALNVERFGVLGVSGGGPGALACAWKIPERLISVGVVASPAPTNATGVFEGMSRTNRFFIKLAWRLPWLSTLNIRFLTSMIRLNPARYVNTMKFKVHRVDQAVLARPGIQHMLASDFREALFAGGQGMIDDMSANHGKPWGFALDDISTQVHFWSCELDLGVPPAMGRYLSHTVPNCVETVVNNAGHLWILENLHDVLSALVREYRTECVA